MSQPNYSIPADATYLPAMKTVMADRSEDYSIRYLPDIEYACRDGISLKLQLIAPKQAIFPSGTERKKYPFIVYVEGSAWGEQDCYGHLPQLCQMAAHGYVIASVKHRSSSQAKFPGFLQDVKSAIRFLRANAGKYGIDPERAAVWGTSSGGHAALMVGVTGDQEEFKTSDYSDYSDSVSAAVDFYGPTDVTRINEAPRDPIFVADKENIPEDILFGGVVAEHPEIAAPGNPLNYVSKAKELPPFLILHGDRDPMVPFNQSVLMAEKLMECGKTVEFFKVRGAGHGEYLWSREVEEILVKFLKAYL